MTWRWRKVSPCDLDEMSSDINPQMKDLEDYLGRVRSSDLIGKPSADGAIPSLATVSHTGNTTETALKSILLGPGSVTSNGGFKITAGGSCTGAGGTKTIRLNWGGIEIASLTVSSGTTPWTLKVLLFNNGSPESIKWQSEGYNGTTLALMTTGSGSSESGDDAIAATLAGVALRLAFPPGMGESWATIIAGNGTGSQDTNPSISFTPDGDGYDNQWITNVRMGLAFPTSGLPTGAIVDSATIGFTVAADIYNDYNSDAVLTKSTLSSTSTMSDSDYQGFKSDQVEYGTARQALSGLTYPGTFTMTLNATALTDLQTAVTATTPFTAGMMSDADFDAVAPTWDDLLTMQLEVSSPTLTVVYHTEGGPSASVEVPSSTHTGGKKWELELTGQLGNSGDTVAVDFVAVEIFA